MVDQYDVWNRQQIRYKKEKFSLLAIRKMLPIKASPGEAIDRSRSPLKTHMVSYDPLPGKQNILSVFNFFLYDKN